MRDKAKKFIETASPNTKSQAETSNNKKNKKENKQSEEEPKEAAAHEDTTTKEPATSKTEKKEENKSKMKKKVAPEVDIPISKDEPKTQSKVEPAFDYLASQKQEKKETRQEVKIEEETIPEKKPVQSSRVTTSTSNTAENKPVLNQEHFKKGQEELSKMVRFETRNLAYSLK